MNIDLSLGQGIWTEKMQLQWEWQLWIWHPGAHWSWHQIWSQHWNLWHGLLCGPWKTRWELLPIIFCQWWPNTAQSLRGHLCSMLTALFSNEKFEFWWQLLFTTLLLITYWYIVWLIQCLGFNVSKRRRAIGKVGPKHKVTKEESVKWFQQKVIQK